MKAKYRTPIFASETINTKGHWAQNIIWNRIGSKGDTYSIEMKDNGWTCDCPARVKCKHIKEIDANF